jgi:hypothetical protein
MSDEVEFDFSTEIQKGRWELLQPHHKRGAVFVVKEPLDLNTVGHALAKDQVNIIKIWLDNGDFKKLEDEDTTGFDDDLYTDICDFLIIQPYVLIKFLK